MSFHVNHKIVVAWSLVSMLYSIIWLGLVHNQYLFVFMMLNLSFTVYFPCKSVQDDDNNYHVNRIVHTISLVWCIFAECYFVLELSLIYYLDMPLITDSSIGFVLGWMVINIVQIGLLFSQFHSSTYRSII